MLQLRQSIRRKNKEKNGKLKQTVQDPPASRPASAFIFRPVKCPVTLSLYDDFPCSAVRHLDDVDALLRL